ncbi:hypothetical protein HK096_009125, partial [Nowakowskiella sp. JEL0078]
GGGGRPNPSPTRPPPSRQTRRPFYFLYPESARKFAQVQKIDTIYRFESVNLFEKWLAESCDSEYDLITIQNVTYTCLEITKCSASNNSIINPVSKLSVHQNCSTILDLPIRTNSTAATPSSLSIYKSILIVCVWIFVSFVAVTLIAVYLLSPRPETERAPLFITSESYYDSFNNASPNEADRADAFQRIHPPPSRQTLNAAEIEEIRIHGLAAFTMQSLDSTWIEVVGRVVLFKGPIAHSDACVVSRMPLARLDALGIRSKLDFKTSVYFEVSLLEVSFDPLTVVSVGLATGNYPPFRLVGWNKYSIGIHSDDGRVYENDKFGGRSFTGPFSVGQTVGCGYDLKSGRVFFTIDGVYIGEASKQHSRHPYHACIGADGKAKLVVNFGETPFVYQL